MRMRFRSWWRGLACLLALVSGAATAELTQATANASNRAPSRERAPSVSLYEGIAPATETTATPIATPGLPTPCPERDAAPIPRVAAGDGVITTGASVHRLILFTFDDGPNLRYTEPLLDALDLADVRAVFFVTTRRFAGNLPHERQSAELVRDIVRRGHIIGTHTMDHIQLPLVSNEHMQVQVDESADLIEGITGARPVWVRPPGGSRSARVDGYLARTGFTQMLWNLGTGDSQVRSSDDVLATFRRVLERREADAGERGGIVLLHDIHAWSVEAFPRIVAYLDQRNCELLEQGEELFDFVDDPALFYRQRGPREDASSVAPLLALDEGVLKIRQARARIRAEARCADPEALSRLLRGPVRRE